jgi:hypothetical protein
MCKAAAEGASSGAVRAAYDSASKSFDEKLSRSARPAAAAAAAASASGSSDSDGSVAMRSDYVRASNRKSLLHKVLTDNGVNQLTVKRKMDHGKRRGAVCSTSVMLDRVLDADQWLHPAPDGAYAHELTAAVCDLYRRKPRLTWSQLEVLLDEGVCAAQ